MAVSFRFPKPDISGDLGEYSRPPEIIYLGGKLYLVGEYNPKTSLDRGSFAAGYVGDVKPENGSRDRVVEICTVSRDEAALLKRYFAEHGFLEPHCFMQIEEPGEPVLGRRRRSPSYGGQTL